MFPALWYDPETGAFDRGAGFRRNRYIVEASDVVMAFWDGKSRGTENSMDIARELGKPLKIISFVPEKVDKSEPKEDPLVAAPRDLDDF